MSKRVLIVEDDALSLKLMRDVLQAHGFDTREATDGRDALGSALSLTPNLIVMDIGLPGMDGIEVTRRLKSDLRTAGIPVLAVTAFAMPDDERRMQEAGCDAFLTKPLSLMDFVSTIESLIASRASELQ